ncbi:MAG TPA: aspartyl protease family protein [Croceibacterium sp.]|nr:aspartyl protease family protein [Croceibacterium sp.]
MTWHMLAAAAAVLATPLTAVSDAPATPDGLAGIETSPEAEILEIERERYRRMTVPVTIGEEGPFRFMIDTGAQATVLSRGLADRLELFDRDSALLVGMASQRHVETTAIPDFGLGTRRFYIRTAPLVEGANIGDADGILGLDSLQDQRVLIDFVKEQIHVADAKELGGDRGYEIIVEARERLGQLIITEARLDGIDVAVIVDTGAQGSIGNMALLERLRRTRQLGEIELTDVNGVQLSGPVKMGRALSIGRASLNNFPILFTDSPPFRGLGLADEPALILGMAELKLFRRVAIDFKTRHVLFDLPRNAQDFQTMIGRRMGV